MTHINGTLKWTYSVFLRYEEGDDGLKLILFNGSQRTMLYDNWESSYPKTLSNLKAIPKGAAIRFATWNGYDETVWFCDVEQV